MYINDKIFSEVIENIKTRLSKIEANIADTLDISSISGELHYICETITDIERKVLEEINANKPTSFN